MVPFKLSIQKMAELLCLSPLALTRLLDGESKITPELAHRLAKNLGRTPESWLSLQAQYDIWCEKEQAKLKSARKYSSPVDRVE